MPREDWKRVIQIIDEAYAEYLRGMKVLGKQVVAGVGHKVRNEPTGPRMVRWTQAARFQSQIFLA
jgi:hypothetical protein